MQVMYTEKKCHLLVKNKYFLLTPLSAKFKIAEKMWLLQKICNIIIFFNMSKFSENTKGIIYLVASAFCFALMAAFVKLAGNIHFVQKAFFRNSMAFLIALVLLLKDAISEGREALIVPKKAWIFLLLRSLGGCLGIFGNFYAVDRLCLSDAAILNKLSPFFAIIFSYFLMKEKIRLIPFLAIIGAFLGSLLVIKPSFDFEQTLPTLVGFLGGLGAGFAYSCVRKLAELKCNSKIVVLFFSCFSMLLAIPYMITSFNPMTLQQFLYLCAAGICAAGGQFGITAAYYHAPARDISIYDYSQIVFSTLLSLIIFNTLPDIYSFIGYVIIIAMAIWNYVWTKKNSLS